jgi:hypothetical protein
MKLFVTLLAVLSLFACAAYKPVPDGYTGPVATIRDTGLKESGAKAQMFVLVEIDGHTIPNSLDESASASHGLGFFVRTMFTSRQVPARPMKLKLRGTHITGAPIHAIFSQAAGTFFSVEGTVEFTPSPGGYYEVKGELKKEGSSVWIEDSRTNQPVTQKITGK